MKHIAIIGGGRWAKTILSILVEVLPEKINISIYTTGVFESLTDWISRRKYKNKIIVKKKISFRPENFDAVFVLNAAKDHFSTVSEILDVKVPVFVEKPISTSYNLVSSLVNLSIIQQTKLACSHVFLFNKYLNNFSKYLKIKKIAKIEFYWFDPSNEKRYNFQKTYDQGLPIYLDILPHVLSILQDLLKSTNWVLKKVNIFKGGGHIIIIILIDGIDCHINLKRNAHKRLRKIKVKHEQITTLDFTKEPGIIIKKDSEINADENWNSNVKPLKKMLLSFLNSVNSKELDKKLDPRIDLKISEIIDMISIPYEEQQLLFFQEKFSSTLVQEPDIEYFLKEIFCSNHYFSNKELDTKIEFLILHINRLSFKKPNEKMLFIKSLFSSIKKSGSFNPMEILK